MRIWYIGADADQGGGTRRGEPQPIGATSGRAPDRSGVRVLIVDDDVSILETVASILRGEGYQVAAVESGEHALARARTWHPTLILLDMRMPGVDGWAVARSLRESGSRVPVVVMSAAESAEAWASEIAAEGHLAKPFGIDDLIETVERYANRGGRPN